MNRKYSINYLYFGVLFIILTLLHVYHVLLIKEEISLFFVTYAVGQSFLEIFLLMWIISAIRSFAPKKLSFSLPFVCFTFFLFLFQLIDFPLVRLMDMSIWFGFDCMADESWTNFLEMLTASSVSLMSWFVAGIAALIFIGAGVIAFYWSERFTRKHHVLLSSKTALKISFVTLLCLAILDIETTPSFPISSLVAYQKALPWKRTLFSPPFLAYALPANLAPKKAEATAQVAEEKPLASKPDIFLFVIESLRSDFITPEVAPHLFALKKKCIVPKLTLSNANATQLSWFCIFHAKFPFYFSASDTQMKKEGSLPLQLLKDLGYKIHLYSSARLSYYQMDEMIFGEKKKLADEYHFLHENSLLETHVSDATCFKKLQDELLSSKESGGRVFILFLDSTHFEYSWPKNFEPPFTPYPKEMNYIKIACSKESIEGIKNRYRNAIHYLDSHFGQLFKTLKKTKGWSSAIMAITGDHGEEFFEQGHIFHATELSNVQTQVPIFIKPGSERAFPIGKHAEMGSHMDIFPTILHLILGNEKYASHFQGESFFTEKKWPFTVVARYNGGRNPFEFFIHNGTYKLMAKFQDEKKIFNCRSIDILSAKDLDDSSVPCSKKWINKEFGEAIHTLFPAR